MVPGSVSGIVITIALAVVREGRMADSTSRGGAARPPPRSCGCGSPPRPSPSSASPAPAIGGRASCRCRNPRCGRNWPCRSRVTETDAVGAPHADLVRRQASGRRDTRDCGRRAGRAARPRAACRCRCEPRWTISTRRCVRMPCRKRSTAPCWLGQALGRRARGEKCRRASARCRRAVSRVAEFRAPPAAERRAALPRPLRDPSGAASRAGRASAPSATSSAVVSTRFSAIGGERNSAERRKPPSAPRSASTGMPSAISRSMSR